MARRLGRFVGAAALLLVYLRLDRVLDPAVDAADWRVIAPAAALGGALLTWSTARLGPLVRALLHVVAIAVVMLRVTAPGTLTAGVIPGAETLSTSAESLGYAFEILRFGAPPVLAVAGITALVAAAMWLLAAAWASTVMGGRAWVGLVPALGFYLYLALVDRSSDSLGFNVAFAIVAALTLVATSDVVPDGAGRLRARDHRPLPRWEAGPAAVLAGGLVAAAVLGVGLLTPVVPAGGAIEWRNPGGDGSGGDGFSVSPFVTLRQSILSLSDEPVFLARVEPAAPRGPASYWRLFALDRFDGTEWSMGEGESFPLPPEAPGPTPGTLMVTQTITVESLSSARLPSLSLPVDVDSEEGMVTSTVRVGDDGTLSINPLTFSGLTYRVESRVPGLDVAALASSGGELTPLFAAAVEEGRLSITPVDGAAPPTRPPGIDDYLALPDGIDPAIADLARQVSAHASSQFEQAWLLEDFLRGFDYSTAVSTGHSALDLAAWLTDSTSQNYREGYCEQFAAAMGVMGRLLGLPTRIVIGFTAGDRQNDVAVVRERNAHAWVEVWIDGQGWVGFDPTPRGDVTSPVSDVVGFDPGEVEIQDVAGDVGVDPADQPGLFDGGIPNLPNPDQEGTATAPNRTTRWLGGLLMLVAGLGLTPAVKSVRSQRRRRRAAAGDVTAAWEEIVDRLSDLGAGPAPDLTPIEYAETTGRHLLPLARAYAATVYGNRPAADYSAHLASAERWLGEAFDRRRRMRAALNPRSLIRS